MNNQIILIYALIITLFSVLTTLKDKRNARNHKKRIRESTLLYIAFFGGALPMYITMKRIHHKTKHKKFMVGLPFLIIINLAVYIISLIFANN